MPNAKSIKETGSQYHQLTEWKLKITHFQHSGQNKSNFYSLNVPNSNL